MGIELYHDESGYDLLSFGIAKKVLSKEEAEKL